MKLRVEHDVFADAVSWVARTIPSRPSLPVLAGMKIEADKDGSVALSSYDPDISSHAVIEAAVDEPGTTLVHGRLLSDFARALPNKPIDMELKGAKLEVVCGSSHISMQSMPLEDYPSAPPMPEVSGVVDGALWQETVAQVVTAASSDDTLPLLVSVCIEIEGKTMSLMATDRYRLAVRDLTWEPANEDASHRILVRASRLSDIAKALGSVGKVELAIDNSGRTGMIGFSAAGRHNVARLIDGEYPQVRNLFPSEATGYAVIGRQEMLDAIKRARLVVEKNSAVRLSFSEGQVILEAGQGDNAQTSEALEATLHGEDIVMAFNPSFLQEGLGATSAPYVRLSFTSASKPAVLTAQPEIDGEDDQEFRLLLMPIRTYGG
ncbi:DNA polymerase III subunit beta [Peptidiphaga gingivicola]|uniref:Beta sliding clamp n=1 Tax=Peptidiphaga gingivicola TaxID=2741497 RepID=A0A179B431_9ACTO|nr:DNA polymerase III subunit beta [Peptidiphaga gingivicola]OAP85983.1 DNA polymerase III subunit beta [Peptidiphaga gingivicola]